MPYQIIDLDKINAPSIQTDILNFRIAFTCEIPGSETNLLKFYTLSLNLTENGIYVWSTHVLKSVGAYDY